jgi:hypothetical protein
MKSKRHGGSLGGFLVALVLGGLVGAGVCYFVLRDAKAAEAGEAAQPERQPQPEPEPEPAPAPQASEDYISRKLREWNLTPEELKRDLATAGRVVREKGRELGGKVKAATADVTIVAKIKAKYTLDDQLPALEIIVDCQDGHVKLSGTVPSVELIGRAIALALDTDGVVDVVSSIKVAGQSEPV